MGVASELTGDWLPGLGPERALRPCGVVGPAPVGSHAAVLNHLSQVFRGVAPPPQSRPEEALEALLGSMVQACQFRRGKSLMAGSGCHPARVAEFLEPEVAKLLTLAGSSELLAQCDAQGAAEPIKPYIDPAAGFLDHRCSPLFPGNMNTL